MKNSKEMVFADSSTAMVNEQSVDDLIAMGNAADTASVSFLKFSKNGQWLFGADEDTLEDGEVLYVNASTFVAGSILWADGKVQDQDVQPISNRNALRQIDGADAFLGVNFRTMEDGEDLQFHPSSHGGKKFISKLMKAVGLGLKEHGVDKIAMVTLSNDSYKHQKFGKIYTPEFTLVGWADSNGEAIKKLAA